MNTVPHNAANRSSPVRSGDGLFSEQERHESGRRMFELAAELFPICRSITGDGLRATLRRVQKEIPLELREVPSGSQVLDWTVPDEWNIRDAWIADSSGKRVVDFRRSNLHVVNYSAPVRGRMRLAELRPHLHTLPDRPQWIPYRTSYYQRTWGFCLPHETLQSLEDGEYEVFIDSSLEPGSLTYGECLVRGATDEEFLISCHCCHPSLANDNLSGVVLATELARKLMEPPRARKLRCSYRFLFVPGTIGPITWLAQNEESVGRIRHGLVLACLGDPGPFTYKQSRRGNAAIDHVAPAVFRQLGVDHRVQEFSPYGYDERQYGSPGFNLPVGCLMRSPHGTFPEYHTSADNLNFIRPPALAESLAVLLAVVERIEAGTELPLSPTLQQRRPPNRSAGASPAVRFLNVKPKGEPQLGKYGVYEALAGDVMPALWVLNFSDGLHSLGEIATRAKLPFDSVARAADVLLSRGLLKEVDPSFEAV